ncbi:MAG TPA: RDD family protein [Victivallales bacterium]|nr:RDD family protein [Victivallales bacterium]
MKYIIFADDGKEYGPVDAETLRKWVEGGRVLPHTQVRNMMMKKWNRASDLDFLKEAFDKQEEKVEEQKSPFEHGMEFLRGIFKSKKAEEPKSTAFRNTYIPNPASLSLRIGAFLFDLIIILFYALILSLIFAMSMKAGFDVNSAFILMFFAFFVGVVIYYAATLGVYAQTFGMWFWGIMIVSSDVGEVLLGRAYFYTLCMVMLGVSSPLVVYLNPDKRSLPEYISGTKIIRISAKPKV